MKGWELIAIERTRQIRDEGWTPEHDDEHFRGDLVRAAWCYLTWAEPFGGDKPPDPWPWEDGAWKPSDPIRNLVKAGALIAAEIDRLQRAAS